MGTENQIMMKGCEVEVCTQKGAYFSALLEENTTISGRKKVSVRYQTLQSDDGSSPRTETVHQGLLRPVPPEEEYSGVVLEEGTVVDAYHRGGWWTGVIISKKLEDGNFLVLFDSPPDIVVFEKTKLRAHVDWTDSKWFRPDLKEVDMSMFSPGTMVEVSSVTDKAEVAWFPAILIKEIEEEDGEKKFIVKDCNHHHQYGTTGEEARRRPNTTTNVDSRRVRPTPPHFSVKVYTLMDRVEAFHGSVWRQGTVRRVLTEKRYMVSFGLDPTKNEEQEFGHSHVRPLKVWEDGAWHNGPTTKPPVEETPKRGRKNLKRSLNHDDETLTKTASGGLRNKRDDAVMMNDGTPPPPQVIITPQEGSSSFSDQSPDVVMKSTYVEETPTPTPAALMALPFAKTLPYWKSHEAKEGYKTIPQRPHFSPLLAAKDDDREICAVGMMASFYSLLEEIKGLKPEDSTSALLSLSGFLVRLEKNGFDIDAPRARITKMMSIKEEQAKNAEEKECLERKVDEDEKKSRKLAEEMAELKRKMLELQRREVVAKEEREAAEKRVVEMKANGERLEQKMEDMDIDFLNTASAPW